MTAPSAFDPAELRRRVDAAAPNSYVKPGDHDLWAIKGEQELAVYMLSHRHAILSLLSSLTQVREEALEEAALRVVGIRDPISGQIVSDMIRALKGVSKS